MASEGQSNDTSGARPISIAGRVALERERLIGMTNEERAWRSKYLKSQILAPEEPLNTPEYYQESFNPLRRLYKAPMNVVENKILVPVLGETVGGLIRVLIGKFTLGAILIYGGWYYFRYNMATWERQSGWNIIQTRPTLLPKDKDFPHYKTRKPNEYATLGFEKSKI